MVETCTRTVHGRALLRPEPDADELIVGALGRAAEYYGIELYCFAFLSSHYHLIYAKIGDPFRGWNPHYGLEGVVRALPKSLSGPWPPGRGRRPTPTRTTSGPAWPGGVHNLERENLMKKRKRKLNLDDLEIESFATTVASEVVGGSGTFCIPCIDTYTCDPTSCQDTCQGSWCSNLICP